LVGPKPVDDLGELAVEALANVGDPAIRELVSPNRLRDAWILVAATGEAADEMCAEARLAMNMEGKSLPATRLGRLLTSYTKVAREVVFCSFQVPGPARQFSAVEAFMSAVAGQLRDSQYGDVDARLVRMKE